MKIKFYLKDKKSSGKTPITLSFSYNGKRLRYSTGISIKPKSWNEKNEQVFSGVKDSIDINEILEGIENDLKSEYRKIIRNKEDIPEPDYFKEILDKNYKNTTQTDGEAFFDYYDKFLAAKEKEGVDIKRYKGLETHLKNIEKVLKRKLTFKTFSRKFYQPFLDYFVNLKHANKTIRDRHIKDLQAFLNWCVFNEYTPKNEFKGIKFPFQVSEPSEIALTEKELNILHNLDFSKNLRLQNVRDVFLLECYTGVRFSDLNKITPENIKGNELHIYTEKTRENNVIIPLRPEVFEILNRYHKKGLELPLRTNQKTNKYLKELGKIAGFDDSVSWIVLSGRNKIYHKEKRYNKLQTHTGRRTFITTNIERGLTPLQIMSITTHRTYSEFQKYYKPERINIKQQYLAAWSQIKTKYDTSELIKRLLINGVSKEVIKDSFGIEFSDIDKLSKN